MPRHPDGSISISTIGDMIDEGYRASYYCDTFGCENKGDIDFPAFGEWLGRDHGALKKDLERYYKCPLCGGRKVSFSVQPPVPVEGVVTPSATTHVPREGVSYRAQKRRRKSGRSEPGL